jgi:hypothetical protein
MNLEGLKNSTMIFADSKIAGFFRKRNNKRQFPQESSFLKQRPAFLAGRHLLNQSGYRFSPSPLKLKTTKKILHL